jgi:hypothetical protein
VELSRVRYPSCCFGLSVGSPVDAWQMNNRMRLCRIMDIVRCCQVRRQKESEFPGGSLLPWDPHGHLPPPSRPLFFVIISSLVSLFIIPIPPERQPFNHLSHPVYRHRYANSCFLERLRTQGPLPFQPGSYSVPTRWIRDTALRTFWRLAMETLTRLDEINMRLIPLSVGSTRDPCRKVTQSSFTDDFSADSV